MTAFAILSGIVALLLVPVDVGFEFASTDRVSGKLGVRWLFGLVRARINLPRPAGVEPDAEKPVQRGNWSAPRHMLVLFRQTTFRRRLYRFASDLLDILHVKRLDAHLRLGLDDPAETGRLYALIWPLKSVLHRHGVDIRVDPDFLEPIFELEAHGRIVLIPLQFIALVATFALSPLSLRAWRQLRSSGA